jgi:hypothetical protein
MSLLWRPISGERLGEIRTNRPQARMEATPMMIPIMGMEILQTTMMKNLMQTMIIMEVLHTTLVMDQTIMMEETMILKKMTMIEKMMMIEKMTMIGKMTMMKRMTMIKMVHVPRAVPHLPNFRLTSYLNIS